MIALKNGQYGITKQFSLIGENIQLGYSAERNKDFLVLLLGVQKRKERIPERCDIEAILSSMGWVTFDRVQRQFGKEETKKFLDKTIQEIKKEINDEVS